MLFSASVTLSQRTSDTMKMVDRSWQVLAFTLVVTFVLAVLIASRLVRQISAPISRLVAETERLESGDLGRQIEHDESDEIGVLMDAYNKMSLALASN